MRAPLATVLAGLLLAACGDGEKPAAPPPGGPPPPVAPRSPTDPSTPSAAGAPTRPAFASAAQCGNCHKEIYAEWVGSMHGQAMTDPLFLELSDGLKQEECIRCHAPVPLRETENWETPIARSDRREDAVSCLTCHQAGGHVAGPHKDLTGPCRPVYDPDQTDVTKICFGCHNQHFTGEEWLAGPYAPDAPLPRKVEAKTCLDCHMPAVARPLVPGGPVRQGRRHTWPGGHSMEQVRKAVKLEAETKVEDGNLVVTTWVTNVGAGHNVPTDARHRCLDVFVKVLDASGKVVLDPLDPLQQPKAQAARYRLNYRNSNVPDTQIPPLARVSKMGTWSGTVTVPGVTAGTGEAWLVYRMTPKDALTPESLVDGEYVKDRARRVVSVPFTFGKPEGPR